MKQTFGQAKAQLAIAARMTATDSRLLTLTNEAQERLLYLGKWVGTMIRYKVCTSNACLTWPRAIETIEAYSVCDWPGTIRNGWYEFLDNGPGVLNSGSCNGYTLVDRGGNWATFDDITKGETDRKIRVYADVTESATAVILLQGYDENNNWIRTQVGGVWIDGEEVAISTTPVLSVNFFTAITAVKKPVTNGVVRIYEYDNTNATNIRALGFYEPDEEVPQYRRSLIPGLPTQSGGDCDTVPVEVYAKLRFAPVTKDADWLMIQHVPALKLAIQAVLKEQNNLFSEAEQYWFGMIDPITRQRKGGAVGMLNDQLRQFLGEGAVPVLRMVNSRTWGGGIYNVQ